MIIKAKNREISVKGIQSESIRQNGKSYPALRITVDGGLPQTEIDALCSGMLEIVDDSGNVIGTHEGYTTNAEHSLIVGKITTADQEIAELENEITATKQEHTAYVATVQTILPVLDDAEAVTVTIFGKRIRTLLLYVRPKCPWTKHTNIGMENVPRYAIPRLIIECQQSFFMRKLRPFH